MSILEKLASRAVLADGRVGGILASRGTPVESLCVQAPDAVAEVHTAFAEAGSEVIRTNSFAANAIALAEFGLEKHVNEINWQASQIARQAVKGREVTVAGSVGPLPVAGHVHAEAIFREQIGALLDGGAQMIFFEGFTDLADLLIALEVKYSLHHCPAVCAMVFDDRGCLPDGTDMSQAFVRLARSEADIVGFAVGQLRVSGDCFGERPLAAVLPATIETNFATSAENLSADGVRLLAGGTGVLPAHIAAARETLFKP